MLELIGAVLVFTALPVAATVAGAAVAAYRPPRPIVRSYIQHLAAGVVFSVVAVELLPDILRRHQPVGIIVGFAAGVALMMGIRGLTRRGEGDDDAGIGRAGGLIATVAVDLVIDGLLIGMGFAVGSEEGMLLTVALTIELLSLGLAVAASLGRAGLARRRVVRVTAMLALAVPVSAAAGATLLAALPDRLIEGVLSFGLAALLYLVTEELLVEAHEEPETPLATAFFFGGFLLFLVLAAARPAA